MKSFDVILFDLDGTLTDSGEGIINSVIYALSRFSISVEDRAELNRFVGPPLQYSFETFYGFSEEQAKKAIEYYREYFREKGMYENSVYDGVEALLKELREKGKELIVATSKPEIFSKQILEHFKLSDYFTYIAGASMDGARSDKSEIIAYALDSCGIADKSSVIMVGDREHDVIGAKKNGIACIGVLYGYGDREELERAGAGYIAEDTGRLMDLLG